VGHWHAMKSTRVLGGLLAGAVLAGSLAAGAGAADAPVASGATRLVVSVDRGLNATADRFGSAASSDRALIDRLIEGVDALPAPVSNAPTCPPDLGARVVLAFYRGERTHPYAVVIADPFGCGDVTVITRDQGVRSLDHLSGGASLVTAVLAALGLAPITG
jgi:hypothetical protein